METPLIDIYLTGQLAAGVTAADAAARFAQLFKTSPETAAGLINGKPQLIKRGVDTATAQKYRDVLQRAGLEITLRPQTESQPAVATSRPAPASAQPASAPPTTTTATGLSLAAPGTDVLRADERQPPVAVDIDTSHLRVAAPNFTTAEHQSIAEQRAAIVAPELSLSAPGGDLLLPEEKTQPVAPPPIPALTLAEAGALLETLHVAAVPVVPNLEGLSLAPAGTDLLTDDERPATPAPVTPDISHLRLGE